MLGTNKNPSGTNNSGNEDYYSQLVNGDADVPDEKTIHDIFLAKATEHAADAIDYEDIDEFADDDQDLLADDLAATAPRDNDDENERSLQAQAEGDFDDMFGGDEDLGDVEIPGDLGIELHGLENQNDIFNDLNNNHMLDDDGLKDLNIFDDDLPVKENQNLGGQKRRADFEQHNRAKKQKLQRIVKRLEAKRKEKQLAFYFPDFKHGKPYNNHYLNLPAPIYYSYKRAPIALRQHVKPLIPTKISLELDVDQRKVFRSRKVNLRLASSQRSGITNITEADLSFIEQIKENGGTTQLLLKPIPFMSQDGTGSDRFVDFSKDLILSTTDWNDDAIMNAGDTDEPKPVKKEFSDLLLNTGLDYDDDLIFNGQLTTETFKLDMNDPNLLFVPEKTNQQSKALIPVNEKLMSLKFNISNDKAYDILKNNYNTKVRSQLSNLNIEHSVPALRLQTPYYKVKMTTDEARAFHRPKFVVRPGSVVSFSKLKLRKKKKDRGKTSQEIFTKTSDLTATDSGSIICMEYAEEYPHVLSNFGMGSKLINYYRKEREDDNSRPKAPLGETHVLGVEDRSPFWNFGYVEKGDFVPTLYNNMVRAPVFQHEPQNTDFLLIRSQGAGNHQRHYLRPFDHLFAVGHVFPAVEVPAPQSRKVTNASKNRLKMVVFRTMNKNGTARVSVKDISQHFPDQNDMQNRQRLKEFMEYQRQGDDQGFWKIRNSDVVPTEDEIRTMLTPEDVTLLDSMQYGVQVLEDYTALYGEDAEKESKRESKKDRIKDEDEDRSESTQSEKPKKKDKDDRDKERGDGEEDVDDELTPWSSSRNFVISNQTKAMLQLNGEGDPTGIGLGFSFLRSTQKNTFHPLYPPPKESVPKNNTSQYQQKLYEQEVSRIWYAQRRSLTVDNHNGHTLDTIYSEYEPLEHKEFIKSRLAREKEERSAKEGSLQSNVLKITRRIRDENGVVQRKIETISDPRLIKAYIKRKKQIEGDKMSLADVGDIIPTHDLEMNKIRKKALEDKIASLQKRAKLSKGRKGLTRDPLHAAAANGGTVIDANTVMLPDGSYAIGGKGIGKGNSRTRRCASCGSFGHIRTNKSCPLYHQTNGGTAPLPKASDFITPSTPTGASSSPAMPPSSSDAPQQ